MLIKMALKNKNISVLKFALIISWNESFQYYLKHVYGIRMTMGTFMIF